MFDRLIDNAEQGPLGLFVPLIERKRGASSNQAPTAAFSSVVTLLSVAFTDLSTDPDGTIAAWDWDWGDSTIHGTTQNPTHVYAAGGTYTVTLTTTDNLGATNAVSHSVTAHAAPVAAFTSVTTLLSVAFTDTSTADTASGATITSWAWTFGDAGTSTSQSPTHPYATKGSKSVTLTVTDSFGATNAVTRSVTPDITKDATSGKRMPQTSADFTAIGVTAPDHLYLMQEASGNLADSIGAIALTVAGSPSYQQTVSGWSTKAIKTTETTSQGWSVASGTGPSPASTSVAFFALIKFTGTPGGTRDLMMLSGATSIKVSVLGTGKIRINALGVTADSASSHNDGNVHPVLAIYNRTGASVHVYTDLENWGDTYGAGALDGSKGFGALGSTNAPMDFLQGWIAAGAIAEGYGAATLTALGW